MFAIRAFFYETPPSTKSESKLGALRFFPSARSPSRHTRINRWKYFLLLPFTCSAKAHLDCSLSGVFRSRNYELRTRVLLKLSQSSRVHSEEDFPRQQLGVLRYVCTIYEHVNSRNRYSSSRDRKRPATESLRTSTHPKGSSTDRKVTILAHHNVLKPRFAWEIVHKRLSL